MMKRKIISEQSESRGTECYSGEVTERQLNCDTSESRLNHRSAFTLVRGLTTSAVV